MSSQMSLFFMQNEYKFVNEKDLLTSLIIPIHFPPTQGAKQQLQKLEINTFLCNYDLKFMSQILHISFFLNGLLKR